MPEFVTFSALLRAIQFVGGAVVGGVLENRSDDIARTYWQQFRENLKQYRPDAKHELNRAIYCSYLQATLQICGTRAESLGLNIDLWFQTEASSSIVAKVRKTFSHDKPLGLLSIAENQFLERLVKDLFAELSKLAKGEAEPPAQYKHVELDSLMRESELLMRPQKATERLEEISERLCERLLTDLESKYAAEFGTLSDDFKRVVRERWFGYLCACFHHIIKHQQPVANSFHSTLLAKIVTNTEVRGEQEITPAVIEEQLAGFGGETVTWLEQTFLWMQQEQREGFERVENLLNVMLPLLAVVGDEERRQELLTLIYAQSQRVIDELSTLIQEEEEKTRNELRTGLTDLKQHTQVRTDEKAIDFTALPSLDATVYDRDEACEAILQALRGEMGRGKIWSVVAPSTFGKTFLATKVLQQVTDGHRITATDVRKILYVDCRSMTVSKIVENFGRLIGQSQHLAEAFRAFREQGEESLADWMSIQIFQPLQALGTTWMFWDNFEAWLDARRDYRVKQAVKDEPSSSDELEQFILSFFQKNHNVRVLMLTQVKPALMGIHEPRELEWIGKAMYRGLPKTDETDFALDYLRTEGTDVGLNTTDKELLLDFIDRVWRNPMALASLVGYLRTIKYVHTFEEVISEEKLFKKLDEYEHAKDRTKYLIRKQIAAQSDQVKRLLCALAFFDRPLPLQALEIFLPERAAETIARLIMNNLATSTIGARGTHRYELHALFSELTRQDEFHARFTSTLDGSLANLFREKGDAANHLTYFSRAIDLYDCALAIYLFLDNDELAGDLAKVYANKGVALTRLGQIPAAIAEYDKAIAMCERLIDREGRTELANNLAKGYMNKGNALDELGQPQEAIAEYDKMIAVYEWLVFEERHTELADDLARAFMNRGVALRHLGRSQEAIAEYDKAIAIREWLVNQEQRSELAGNLARVYKNKGAVLDDLKQSKEAIAEYDKAIAIYERLINQERHTDLVEGLANVYMNKALTLTGDSKWLDSLTFYDKSTLLCAELIQQAGRLELLSLWVRVHRLGILSLARLERWEEVAEKVIDVSSLFSQWMGSGQIPNPDAARQEFNNLISTLREFHASGREKILAACARNRSFIANPHTAALRKLLA